uniref:WD_REPEATS_REGION domain-containing protein n=1 Tax=Heterorhabditis bacteriophora TaxID=37862 RepID=A0A1I7XNU5_HETBA
MVPEAKTDDEETSIAYNSVDIGFIRGRIGSAPESAGAQARRDTKLSCRVSCCRVYSGSYTSQLYSMLPSTSSRSGSEKYKIPNAVNKPPAKLDVVLGRTVVGPNSLAVNDKTARFAYVAGACIVVSSLEGRLNEGHLIGTARHPFTCLSFSSCGKYIATGESGHQPCIRIWEVKDEGGRLYGQQIKNFNLHSISVVAVRFVPGTSLLVSVGCQHDGQICAWDWRSGTKLGIGKVSAPSRSAILADRRSSTFVDAVFLDSNRLLAITEDGCLVEFTNKKYVNTYQFDGKNCPLCLNLTANAVVLGCTNGIVQLYSREDLSPIEKLPHPAYIGMDPAVATSIDMVAHHPDGVGYPDARVVAASSAEIFIVVYADRSMFVYQKVENQWLKKRSSLAHVGSINVIMTLPSHLSHLPSGSFLTGGSDGTVRIWNLDGHRNEKVIHFLINMHLSLIFLCRFPVYHNLILKVNILMQTSVCFQVNVKNQQLALDVLAYHLMVNTWLLVRRWAICSAPYLLASGGRDRLVHLFRPGPQRYTHSHVIEDHQSSINSIKFVKTADNFYVYTCAADKVIVIWRLISFTEKSIEFFRENLISAPVSLNHLLISPSGNSLLTACHDRQLRSYSLRGKLLTTVKGTGGEADIHQGTLNKFCIDPSGSFAATICSDRQVYVVDARSGNCVAAIGGTGDAATDVSFSNDCRRLYVTSANGCIFVWRLSDSLVDRMLITKKSMDDMSPRTPSPDSLLGSGSEAVSDEPFLNLIYNIGTPHFGSSESLSNWKDESIVPIDFSAEKDKEKDISLVVRPAQIARRSNLFTATDPASGDISDSESQSDFISKRSTQIIQYQSSKSMVNLRDDGLGQGATANLQGIIANHLDRPPRRIRSGWANPPPPSVAGKEDCHMTPRTRLVRPLIRPSPQYVQMRSNGHAPSQSNVSQTLSVSVAPNSLGSNQFRRDTPDRVSLTKRFMQESQPRTVWTPQTMTPRRTTSNMQSIAPSGAVASAITRRQSEQFRVRFKTRQKNGASNDSAYRLQPQKTVDTSSVPSNKFRGATIECDASAMLVIG